MKYFEKIADACCVLLLDASNVRDTGGCGGVSTEELRRFNCSPELLICSLYNNTRRAGPSALLCSSCVRVGCGGW